jgi:hypothetical protein
VSLFFVSFLWMLLPGARLRGVKVEMKGWKWGKTYGTQFAQASKAVFLKGLIKTLDLPEHSYSPAS